MHYRDTHASLKAIYAVAVSQQSLIGINAKRQPRIRMTHQRLDEK